MKKIKITIYLLLFVCLSIFGQQAKTVSIQGQPQKTSTQVSTNQQELILHLQAENEAMKAQLDRMEKEIELYRGDVRAKVADFNDDLSQWLTIMGLMMAVIGIAIPLILSRRNENFMERMLDDVKQQANSAEKQAQEATTQAIQAKQAVTDIEELKKHVTEIEGKINRDTIAAEKAAKEAMVSKLFAQAVSEKVPSKEMELYSRIIEIDPNIAEVYNNRGILRNEMNDLDGALQDYNKAIELDPNDAATYCNRGVLRNDMKDPDGALQDYNKAIELDPNYAMAFNNRADLYLKMNALDKALADVNHSIDLGNGYVSFITKGEIYKAMEKYSDAIDLFNQALSYNGNCKEPLEYRAKCYRRLAETEPDEEKKAELIAMAEADEQKAKSTNKEGEA